MHYYGNATPQASYSFNFPWRCGLLTTFGVFLVGFCVLVLTGVAMAIGSETLRALPAFSDISSKNWNAGFELLAYCEMFGMTILVLYVFVGWFQDFNELTRFGLARLRRSVGRVLRAGAAGYGLALALTLVVYCLVPLPSPHDPFGESARTLTGVSFVLAALGTSVAAPLMEELLFRGFVQNMLRGSLRAGFVGRSMGMRVADVTAVIMTAALFAAMHLTLSGFVPLFISGVILGEVYRRTDNLWASMAMHAFNNVTAMALLAVSI